MSAQHTPGPWRVSLTDDTVVVDATGHEVAAIDGDYNDPDTWPLMEANARVIAAAPDHDIDSVAALVLAQRKRHVFQRRDSAIAKPNQDVAGHNTGLFGGAARTRARKLHATLGTLHRGVVGNRAQIRAVAAGVSDARRWTFGPRVGQRGTALSELFPE